MRKLKRNRVKTDFNGQKTKTVQSDLPRTDIKKMLGLGVNPPDPSEFVYGDFSDGNDFQSVQNRIMSVNAIFDSLPSAVRKELNNDPAQMLDALNDPERAIKLGLTPPPKIDLNEKPNNTVQSTGKTTTEDIKSGSQKSDENLSKPDDKTSSKPDDKTSK